MRSRLAAAVFALCVVVPMASAAESSPEREEYVAKAEAICKTNVLANKRIFAGVKKEVRTGKLKLASRRFFRAARAFAKTVRQLAAVPQPPADAPRLSRWLGILRTEKTIIEKIGRALAAGDKHEAVSDTGELSRNSNKANNVVLAFDFNYCRIEPSRFE